MIAVIPSELEDQVLDADASGNKLRVDALLLGAIKNLKLNKTKPDAVLYMNMMYLAKSKPELFLSNRVVEASLSILLPRLPNIEIQEKFQISFW